MVAFIHVHDPLISFASLPLTLLLLLMPPLIITAQMCTGRDTTFPHCINHNIASAVKSGNIFSQRPSHHLRVGPSQRPQTIPGKDNGRRPISSPHLLVTQWC